jgi:hypothetical protein
MTVLGGATSFLRILDLGFPLIICSMENVVINGKWVIPSPVIDVGFIEKKQEHARLARHRLLSTPFRTSDRAADSAILPPKVC